MHCPHCRRNVTIARTVCPFCGRRMEIDDAVVLAGAREVVADDRGKALEGYLRGVIVLLFLGGAGLWGYNYLWSRPVTYSGAELPALALPLPPANAPAGETAPARLPLQTPEPAKLEAPPAQFPQAFAYRTLAWRERLRAVNGGDKRAADAIQRGLSYLKRQQTDSGAWLVTGTELPILRTRDQSAQHQWHQVGVSALAVLAFLGEGETWWPDAQGRRGPNAEAVRRALAYLVSSQDAATGRFGPKEGGQYMLNHALAALALSEAAGMSGDAYLRATAQKGVDLIERTQSEKGGWGPTDELGVFQDALVSAWQVQALLAAREAGLRVNLNAFERAANFFSELTTADGWVRADSETQPNMVQHRPELVGAALFARRRMLRTPPDETTRLMAHCAAETLPYAKPGWGSGWAEGTAPDPEARARAFVPLTWYFCTSGLFCSGCPEWEGTRDPVSKLPRDGWGACLNRALPDLQDDKGAWRANDLHTVKYGAVHATALCILALQACYRTP